MDVKGIDELARLMQRYGLSRVHVEGVDGLDVELERRLGASAEVAQQAADEPPASAPTTAAAVPAATEARADAAGEQADEQADGEEVLAPMVGVFYVAPSPGAKPFVSVGSKVHKGDTLCIIEAMKLMNEVRAEQDGEVVAICAEDGELVEYGACIMRIR